MREPRSRCCCPKRATRGWRPSLASASRSSMRTQRWSWWTSRRGSSCTRGPVTHEGTLVGGLLARFPDLAELVSAGVCAPDRPGIVHRLDKGTSGLLAVARTPDAYRELVGQLATRTMERRYLALVVGRCGGRQGGGRGADRPLGPHAHQDGGHGAAGSRPEPPTPSWSAGTGGRPRRCSSSPSRAGGPTRSGSTWRPSGTRWWGMPRYGAPDKRLGSGRFFLHAFKLAFTHPGTGARMEFTSAAGRGPEGLPGLGRAPPGAARPGRAPVLSGRLVDAEHVGVEGQRGQRLLLGPAHPADPHAEALGRRLERRR